MTTSQRCDGCGRFVRECTLLADGDEAICLECWSKRCSARERQECIWIEDEWSGGAWATACGALFVLNDGTPSQNGMLFCHHCGKRLVECPVESPVEVGEVIP